MWWGMSAYCCPMMRGEHAFGGLMQGKLKCGKGLRMVWGEHVVGGGEEGVGRGGIRMCVWGVTAPQSAAASSPFSPTHLSLSSPCRPPSLSSVVRCRLLGGSISTLGRRPGGVVSFSLSPPLFPALPSPLAGEAVQVTLLGGSISIRGCNHPDESYIAQAHKWLELTFLEGCR